MNTKANKKHCDYRIRTQIIRCYSYDRPKAGILFYVSGHS